MGALDHSVQAVSQFLEIWVTCLFFSWYWISSATITYLHDIKSHNCACMSVAHPHVLFLLDIIFFLLCLSLLCLLSLIVTVLPLDKKQYSSLTCRHIYTHIYSIFNYRSPVWARWTGRIIINLCTTACAKGIMIIKWPNSTHFSSVKGMHITAHTHKTCTHTHARTDIQNILSFPTWPLSNREQCKVFHLKINC